MACAWLRERSGSSGGCPQDDDAADGAHAKKKKAKAPRRLTGKCWMAERFPMTLHQLLPVLEARPCRRP
jgi:hypothetical protein